MIRLFSTWWNARRRGRPRSSPDRGLLFRHLLRNELLEDRWVLAVIAVDTLLDESDSSIDDGDVSLRDAIAAAASGDTIDFDASLDGGTILLTQELLVTRSLTIDATSLPLGLTIDASGRDPTPDQNNGDGSRIFNVDDGADDTDSPVTISGLTLINGDAAGFGGAIHSLEGLTVTNCTISGNSSHIGDGGGIHAFGDVTITNSTISGNEAFEGAGGIEALGAVTVTNSTISGNFSPNGGGGIHASGAVTVTNSTISGNSGFSFGGISADTVTVTNSTISGNSADSGGGGIRADTVTVTNSTISGNSSYRGGGGIHALGAVTVTNSTISGSSSYLGGGGIHALGAVTITDSTITGNDSSHGCAGIHALGAVTVTNSMISGNRSNYSGGGIDADAVTVTNSTISGNSGADWPLGNHGGGISGRTISIENSIVARNVHESGAAPDIDARDVASFAARFSLIGDNTGTQLAEAQTPDENGNLIGDPNGAGVIDPLIGPLADNGGPRQTHALLPGSPAINAGDPDFSVPPSFDQRGEPYVRVVDERIDIGAYERQKLTVDILDVTSPTMTAVDEVTIRFSRETTGFDITNLGLSLNGGSNLLTAAQVITTTDGQTFVLSGLSSLTTASGYYTLSVLPLDIPLDSGDTIGWAMGRPELRINVDTLLDEADGLIDDGDVSLRDAIAAAAPNEIIDFDAALDGGTILLTLGDLRIAKSMTIDGTTLPGGLTIDASGNDPTAGEHNADGSRVFTIDDGTTTDSEVTITSLTLTGGDADDGGGAIRSMESLIVTNSTISGNSASWEGGGIFVGAVTVTNSTISGNSADRSGGGINALSGAVTVANSTISRNEAEAGGGIHAFSGAVTVTNSTISRNSSEWGGGICADFDGAVTVANSTISRNEAEAGGGIFAFSGAVTVANSTISGNSSVLDGGGIFAGGSVTVTNSTISGNSSVLNGGGIFAVGAWGRAISIENSIVARNIANGTGPDIDARNVASFVVRFSLIGDNTGTELTEAQTPDENGNLIGDSNGKGVIDPLLGPLADNGGQTQTHALLPGSPAINTGDPNFSGPTDHDQRGMAFVRVAEGRIDMGAFETQLTRAGDFDDNAVVDIDDLDMLVAEIAAGGANQLFDLTGDGKVNDTDLDQWLTVAAEENGFSEPFLRGDSNLDGIVDSQDLNNLAMNWQQTVGFWSRGDFNADGIVNVHDLNELGMNWQDSIPIAAESGAIPEPLTAPRAPIPTASTDLVEREHSAVVVDTIFARADARARQPSHQALHAVCNAAADRNVVSFPIVKPRPTDRLFRKLGRSAVLSHDAQLRAALDPLCGDDFPDDATADRSLT